MTRLEDLDISHTAVTDLSPLKVHAGLKRLNIAALPAEDLRVLKELPMLEEVTVSEEMLPLTEELGEKKFKVRIE